MVQKCCVPNCHSKFKNCRLFAIPYTNKERWSKWTKKCPYLLDYEYRRLDMLRICRRHFSVADIEIRQGGKEYITKDAVPHLNLELKPNGLPIKPVAEDWLWDTIGGQFKKLSAPYHGLYNHEIYATELRLLYLAQCQQLGEVAYADGDDDEVHSPPNHPQLQATSNQPEHQDSDTETKVVCEEIFVKESYTDINKSEENTAPKFTETNNGCEKTFVEESYTNIKESEENTAPKFSWEDTEAVVVIDEVDLEHDDSPEVVEENCGECGGDASGPQWWCVNRGVRACAMCCTQDLAGYWLRAPEGRPQAEVENLVAALRLQLSPVEVKNEPKDEVEELGDAVALPFDDPLAEYQEAPPVPAVADDEEMGSETEMEPRPEQVVPAQPLVVTGNRRQVAIQVATAPVVPRKRKASPPPMDTPPTNSTTASTSMPEAEMTVLNPMGHSGTAPGTSKSATTTRIPIMPLPLKTSPSTIPIYLHTPAQTNISNLQMKSSPRFVASRLPSNARTVLYLPRSSFIVNRLPTTRLAPVTPTSTFRSPASLPTPVLTLPLKIPPRTLKIVATRAPSVGEKTHLADHLYAAR